MNDDGEDRRRRPHGQLKFAMLEHLKLTGGSASIAELRKAVEPVVGEAPASSYRSALQDTRYFERVSPGVFRLHIVTEDSERGPTGAK